MTHTSGCVCGAEPCSCGLGEDGRTMDDLVAFYGADVVEQVSSFAFMGQRLTPTQIEMAIESGLTPEDADWESLMASADDEDDDNEEHSMDHLRTDIQRIVPPHVKNKGNADERTSWGVGMNNDPRMQPLDPTQYRHFMVEGTLVVQGTTVDIFIPCHADDLPPGAAGATEIAERVRRHHATELGDPDAPWQSVTVREFDPPSEMYQVPKGTL